MGRSSYRSQTVMKQTLTEKEVNKATADLESALVPFMKRFPGSAGERQPVHTVYGGAHLFKSDTTNKLGEVAQRFLQEYGRDPHTFAAAIGTPARLADRRGERVRITAVLLQK